MASRFKTCPHEDCGGWYERTVRNGLCPHCERPVHKITLRACPKCKFQFSRAVFINKKRCCPNPDCGVELYYPQGKLKGQTLLLADKEAVKKMKELLETGISKARKQEFAFSPKFVMAPGIAEPP